MTTEFDPTERTAASALLDDKHQEQAQPATFDQKERAAALDLLSKFQAQGARIPAQLRPALTDLARWFSDLPEDLQRRSSYIGRTLHDSLEALDTMDSGNAHLAARLDALQNRWEQ